MYWKDDVKEFRVMRAVFILYFTISSVCFHLLLLFFFRCRFSFWIRQRTLGHGTDLYRLLFGHSLILSLGYTGSPSGTNYCQTCGGAGYCTVHMRFLWPRVPRQCYDRNDLLSVRHAYLYIVFFRFVQVAGCLQTRPAQSLNTSGDKP